MSWSIREQKGHLGHTPKCKKYFLRIPKGLHMKKFQKHNNKLYNFYLNVYFSK
jgi:hypothetical protein